MADDVDIRLPELAASMTSATLTAWLKQPGDRVTAGEPIAEVETDKTTVELEAPADGVLDRIDVPAGTAEVAVGALLARLRRGDVDAVPAADDADAPGSASTGGGSARAHPSAPDGSTAAPADPGEAPRDVPGGRTVAAAASVRPADPDASTASVGSTASTASPVSAEAAVSATPLARRMAALAGLDLAGIDGSGPGGRVMRDDVLRARRAAAGSAFSDGAPSAPASSIAGAPPADVPHTDRPLTAMRRVTAERMARSKRTAPHFYLEVACAVDRLLERRAAWNAAADSAAPTPSLPDPTPPLTVNDVLVRAAALAFRDAPLANAAWTGDAVRVYDRVDVAVAVTTPSGLVTPVVRGADAKPLAAIAAELRDLTARARDGRLRPADYAGGTCTISNLGMFGIARLFAILNPPQSCVLGVGAVERRPVVRDDAVAVGAMLTVTLSADHRALDGAAGAALLRALRTRLEDPRTIFDA